MSSLEIRNFSRDDFHGYCALYRAVMSLKPWDQPDPESELRRLLVDNPFYSPARHFVALSGEKMVGSAWALINPAYLERHGNFPYVDVMVHPQHRRAGLGTTLLSKIRKKVGEEGFDGLDIYVEVREVETSAFLEKSGFSREEKDFLKMEMHQPFPPRMENNATPPPGFTIRNPYLPEELGIIVDNMNACCSTNPGHVLYSNEYIGTRPYIFDPANREGGFLLEKDGKVMGTVFSTIEKTFAGGKDTLVGGTYALGVLPQYRKKGLARLLLGKSMEWLEGNNVEKMYLFLDAKNPSALCLYQQAGFVIVKEEIKYRLTFSE